jgi:putative DNA primase/helicase
MVELDKESLRRLDTWIGQIARALRPDAPVASTADGLRLGRKGSLSITATDGWYDHEAGKGGRDALSLIRHLRACSHDAAFFWARGWLEQHLGDGDFSAEVDAEAAAQVAARRTAWATQVLDDATHPLGTPAEAYLQSRGLTPPYPPGTCWLADARLGESAIVGKLSDATGEFVGVQLGYLDPSGRKSVVQPQRQLFLLDRGAVRQGAFRIDVPEPIKSAPEFIITEGLENALALAQAAVGKTVLGVPGVGRLREMDLPAGAAVVAFRDGKDPADSPAAKAFVKAVDRWLLAKVIVRITDTPSGEDANSVLLAHGPEELRRLVTEAASGQLSFDGELTRLFDLDPAEYERQRVEAAKKHGVRRSFLDDARKAARAEAEAAEEAATDDPPYHEPVTDSRCSTGCGARRGTALRSRTGTGPGHGSRLGCARASRASSYGAASRLAEIGDSVSGQAVRQDYPSRSHRRPRSPAGDGQLHHRGRSLSTD